MKRIFTSLINRGMTLIELLVSIAIFTIITSVVLFNHTEFNSNVLVTNLAYEVALAIRQAQTYGLSVKQGADYPFGVYIDTYEDQSLIIFGDNDRNNKFNPTGQYSEPCPSENEAADGDTCEERLTLRGNVIFSKFCIERNGGGIDCWTAENNDIDWSSILFRRPNPVAIIYGEKVGNNPRLDSGEKAFTITLKSQSTDKEKTVKVERTGQISVVQE